VPLALADQASATSLPFLSPSHQADGASATSRPLQTHTDELPHDVNDSPSHPEEKASVISLPQSPVPEWKGKLLYFAAFSSVITQTL